MAIFAYQRVSKDHLATFNNALQQGAWGEVETRPYEDLAEHLTVPIVALLKLRLSRVAVALVNALSGASDALTSQDVRWDAAQKRYLLKIAMAEADDDPKLQAAGARLRKATTLGNGLGQTQLGYEDEVAFGEKQVLLSRAASDPNPNTHSVGEDVALIGAEGNIKEIEERTAEFKKAIEQTSGGGEVTGRSARIKIAAIDCISELNDAYHELEKQHSAAKRAETRANLKRLQAELNAAVPQEDPPTRPILQAVEPPKA